MISIWNKFYRTLASVRTGVILLIIVSVFSALGTFVLQRPITEPENLQRAYSPTTLMWLDRLGLTDVFHAWWFVGLLGLVSMSIIFVSIDRWPNAWRFYARPYRRPEPHFRAVLPHHTEISISDARQGLDAAERAFKKVGLTPDRIVDNNDVSLFAERSRFSVLAVYFVHASLLLIFLGGIIDGIYGYRGYLQLTVGDTSNKIVIREPNREVIKEIPFSVRADTAGQENYPDGTPKKWWSDLVVIENGQEVQKKSIVVNDPLIRHGIRLYQAGFGMSSQIDKLVLHPIAKDGSQGATFAMRVGDTVPLDADTKLKLVRYIPDYYVQDGEIFQRSNNPENPAFQVAFIDKTGVDTRQWITARFNGMVHDAKSGWTVQATDMRLLPFTGLEVSFQPGQWGVWLGVVLMAFGLTVAFYTVHMRFWAIVVADEKKGTTLWIGGAFNKNKDRFEQKYKALIEATKHELETSGDATGKPQAREMAQV